MSLDLASLDALKSNQEEGAELKVKHPVSGAPIGLVLRIAGADSDPVKRVQRRQLNENMRRRAKTITAEMVENNTREILVASVLGWRFENGLTIDGNVPEFSKDAMEGVLRRFPWIETQIDDFASDKANFLPS